MSNEKQALLVIASRLLGYPSNTFLEELKDLVILTEEVIATETIQKELTEIFVAFDNNPIREIQELYVATFDLKAKTGLYLTAHELGDSTRRGAALIKLQKMINQAGFERMEGELVDYIPMLIEFLAVAPETKDKEQLLYRLAVALGRVQNNLEDDSPYTKLLALLMQHVFPNPSKEEIEQLENNREEADLEEMPYPMLYQ
jgi:nitrate reductase molybdenum cofactor assembly chaperone NarJ/NarW